MLAGPVDICLRAENARGASDDGQQERVPFLAWHRVVSPPMWNHQGVRRLGLVAAVIGLVIGLQSAALAATLPVSYNFLGNTYADKGTLTPPGANIWTCKPTAAHPRPVILVHGTAGNGGDNWGTYSALLHNKGYCVFALTYGVAPQNAALPFKIGGMNEISTSARELQAYVAKVLRATGATKVDLIGHSQGTYMPNYYVRFLGGYRYVDKYVSIAPLWKGTLGPALGQLNLLATAYKFNSDNFVPICAACGEMVTNSAFQRKMASGTLAAPGVQYLNISTRYDELVIPYTSGQVGGYRSMRNVVIQNLCPTDFSDHLEIASSPNVAQVVVNFLDPAHARPVACAPVVLPAIGPLG
jgi:triacylglycerol lipase